MCGRKQIPTSDTIVVTRNLATKNLRQKKKPFPSKSYHHHQQANPNRMLQTYRFGKKSHNKSGSKQVRQGA
jgi:hypothetical protein